MKNIFWLSLGQITSRLFRAVIIIYAARVLGAGEYGVFSYALSLAAFFTIFADIGINLILTREAAQKPNEKSAIFSTALWIKIALLLLTTAIVVFIAPAFSKIEKAIPLLPLVALLVIFDGLRDFSIAFFRALEKMELEAFITIVTNIAIVTFGFIILTHAQTARALTLSYMGSAGLGTLAAIFILKREFSHIVKNFRANLIKPLLGAALPIALLGVLGAFTINVDVIMLGWWRTPEEVGFYAAAQRIVQVLYVLPGILASAIFPPLSRAVHEGNLEKASKIIKFSITSALGLALPLSLGGVLLGTPLINLIYGGEYAPASTALQILILTILVLFPTMILTNYLLAFNVQKRAAVGVALTGLSDVALNALFIPIYGIAGAAVSTVFSQIVNYGYILKICKETNYFNVFEPLKKIIIATIIMGIATFIFNQLGMHVILNILISATVYGGVLFLLREQVMHEVVNLVKGIS